MKSFLFFVLILFFCSSCQLQSYDSLKNNKNLSKENNEKKFESVSVVNWNVQTFFDAQTSGNEYSDFKSMTKWSKDKYVERLKRLVEVMEILNADIFIFEEIENKGILYDIFNQLSYRSWNKKNNWNYGTFANDDNECIGIAILSKYPIENVCFHKMDIRSQKIKQPSSRPLLQATIFVNQKELILFANHWKSKSGGIEETEIWRNWQESILAKTLSTMDKNKNYLICGDFNKDIQDFNIIFNNKEGNINLRFYSRENKKIIVNSPWFNDENSLIFQKGTYYYKNKWEKIDHFFTFGKSSFSYFSPKALPPWADENELPISYKISKGEGYSDHLPIMANIVLK